MTFKSGLASETADLHYSAVVGGSNGTPRKEENQYSADDEEACTSPLLLDTKTAETQEHYNAVMEAEHRQFEQEARELQSAKDSLGCVKLLLACSVAPTMIMLNAVVDSFLAYVLTLVFFWAFCRHLWDSKHISAPLVWTILVLDLMCVFLLQVWVDCYWEDEANGATLFFIAGINLVAGLSYYKYSRFSSSESGAIQEGELRQKQLFFTYMGTIKSVADGVHNSTNNHHQRPKSTELREFFSNPPVEGFYSNIKESDTDNSQLFLLFPPCESPKGWRIRGARKAAAGGVQSVVLEGFVSPTHEAYWTEGTLDGKGNKLYYGKFMDQHQFSGEWLSYKGHRGHEYSLKLQKAADWDEHFGANCVSCGRKALPGTCYTAKARNCYYCQSCVENDSGLVNDEDYVVLELPEVGHRAEDQPYDPPSSTDDSCVGAVQRP